MHLSLGGRAARFALAALLGWLLAWGCTVRPGAATQARVAHVLDGDTLILVDGRHVRLIGVNTPEIGKDGVADEPVAQAARRELERLVRGRDIVLLPGRETHDHYGRLLAHVQLLDGRNVQELLLGAGLGAAVAIPPNLTRQAEYQLAETQARSAGLGIWWDPYYQPVAAERLGPEHRGFRFVTGRVQKVWRSQRYVHIEIGPRLDVLVPVQDLGFFDTAPETLAGKRIVARGWLSSHAGSFQMRLRHPAMLDMVN
ncbi:MAG: thermonuclease family protein [Acidiferrobacterales bacterium]|nr:thermonuclease family protein [Acidiferrobacterales bacterium]